MSGDLRIAASVAFAVTLLAAPPLLVGLRRLGLLDEPCERSSHDKPTPRAGGLAPAVGALASLLAVDAVTGEPRTALLVAAAAFASIGLVDDLWGAGVLHRLALQALVAALALLWLLQDLEGPALWRVVFAAGCFLFLVGYVNAFNFMDGINGISAVQAIVAGSFWVLISRAEGVPDLAGAGATVAVASLAFLPFNCPRARMFLGDVGSYFLGAWLAAAALVGLRAGLPPEAVLSPLAIYVADTGATLVRRVRAGEVWYESHRSHVYQRLGQLGWSHVRTTAFVGAGQLACAGLGTLSLWGHPFLRLAAGTLLVGLMALYVSSPRLLVRAHARLIPTVLAPH